MLIILTNMHYVIDVESVLGRTGADLMRSNLANFSGARLEFIPQEMRGAGMRPSGASREAHRIFLRFEDSML